MTFTFMNMHYHSLKNTKSTVGQLSGNHFLESQTDNHAFKDASHFSKSDILYDEISKPYKVRPLFKKMLLAK